MGKLRTLKELFADMPYFKDALDSIPIVEIEAYLSERHAAEIKQPTKGEKINIESLGAN